MIMPEIGEAYSVDQLKRKGLKFIGFHNHLDIRQFIDKDERYTVFTHHLQGMPRAHSEKSNRVVVIIDTRSPEGSVSLQAYLAGQVSFKRIKDEEDRYNQTIFGRTA